MLALALAYCGSHVQVVGPERLSYIRKSVVTLSLGICLFLSFLYFIFYKATFTLTYYTHRSFTFYSQL